MAHKKQRRELYREKRLEGLCVRPGCWEAAAEGRAMCARHLEAARWASYQRHLKAAKAGRCHKCRKRKLSTRTLCQSCRALKVVQSQRAQKRRRNSFELCHRCGKPERRPGSTRCAECLEYARVYARESYRKQKLLKKRRAR